MNGAELLKNRKRRATPRKIPVFVISGFSDIEHFVRNWVQNSFRSPDYVEYARLLGAFSLIGNCRSESMKSLTESI
jgi:hypothetical protein